MPKVHLLAPLTDPAGEAHASDEEIDVDEDTAALWRAQGKAALVDLAPPPPGRYSEVIGRDAVSPPPEETSRKGKK